MGVEKNEAENVTFEIAGFIPTGHENAISREMLEMKTGEKDRMIRRYIAESDAPIINSGEGYYIPDMNDPVDEANLRAYVLQEQARVRTLQEKIRSKFAALAPDLIPAEITAEQEEAQETEITEPEL